MSEQGKPEEPAPALPYAPTPPAVSRRSFRLLLLLTLINTVLLTIFVAGPMTRDAIKSQWNTYQQRRAAAQQQAKAAADALTEAAERQVHKTFYDNSLTYEVPPGTLVYAEDAEGIAALKATGNAREVPQNRRPETLPLPWPPAMARVAAPTKYAPLRLGGEHGDIFSPADVILFLHGRESSPGGAVRLVAVVMEVEPTWHETTCGILNGDGLLRVLDLTTKRKIKVMRIEPSSDGKLIASYPRMKDIPTAVASGSMIIQPLDAQRKPGEARADIRGQLRFYAGEPDPEDASSFTVSYELDGARGSLQGYLDQSGHIQIKWTGPIEKFPDKAPDRGNVIDVANDRYERLFLPASTQPVKRDPNAI